MIDGSAHQIAYLLNVHIRAITMFASKHVQLYTQYTNVYNIKSYAIAPQQTSSKTCVHRLHRRAVRQRWRWRLRRWRSVNNYTEIIDLFCLHFETEQWTIRITNKQKKKHSPFSAQLFCSGIPFFSYAFCISFSFISCRFIQRYILCIHISVDIHSVGRSKITSTCKMCSSAIILRRPTKQNQLLQFIYFCCCFTLPELWTVFRIGLVHSFIAQKNWRNHLAGGRKVIDSNCQNTNTNTETLLCEYFFEEI